MGMWQVTIIDHGMHGTPAHVCLRSEAGEERRVLLTSADVRGLVGHRGPYQIGEWVELPEGALTRGDPKWPRVAFDEGEP
jgi:hypothetical protein